MKYLLYAFGVAGVVVALLTGQFFALALIGVLTFGFGAIVEAVEDASRLSHLDAKLASTNAQLADTKRL